MSGHRPQQLITLPLRAVVTTSELVDNKVTSYLKISNPSVATSGDYTCTFGTKSETVNIEIRGKKGSVIEDWISIQFECQCTYT